MPNPSLKLTRYGRRRLAAPGRFGNLPSTAKQRSAELEHYTEKEGLD